MWSVYAGSLLAVARRARSLAELAQVLEATRAHRAVLDRYVLVRGSLLQYERTARPVLSGIDGLLPVLNVLRDPRYTASERLERPTARLAGSRRRGGRCR